MEREQRLKLLVRLIAIGAESLAVETSAVRTVARRVEVAITGGAIDADVDTGRQTRKQVIVR